MGEGRTMPVWLGIDVGTGSARAGLFDGGGRMLATASHPIRLWSPRPGWAQQDSLDIWQAVCTATRDALAGAACSPQDVAGIGFDATCSLVLRDAADRPLSADPDGAAGQDVIVWMDHRAIADAEAINRAGGKPLAHVGGTISPEMEMPKLRWLSRVMPAVYAAAANLYDLPDWLVHHATGSTARSLCSTVCKWTYLGHMGRNGEGWDDDFLSRIGLADLTGTGHGRIGQTFLVPGETVAPLLPERADEMGLPAGIPVGASLIDAHAGALGTLGAGGADPSGRLAVIAGTSTCHIALTPEAVFVPGVWGPYFGAVTPGMWCSEGGQSATGAVIDRMLDGHAACAGLRAEAKAAGESPYARLEARLAALAGEDGETAFLTRDLHVQPDLHGNRSPLAAPWRRGAVDGLTLSHGLDDLALLYLATLQALAHGTRHIAETMRAAGLAVDSLVMSGGLVRNRLFLREMADICGCPVLVPRVEEPVLLGAAMLGAVAAGAQPDAGAAMAAMAPETEVIQPRGGAVAAFHDRKYAVFRRMQQDHAAYAELMSEEERTQ